MQTIIPLFILYLSTPPASIPIDTISPVYAHNYTPPTFPGGDEALFKFMQKNMHYPLKAYYKNGIRGMVEVQIAIDKKGNVSDPQMMTRGLDSAFVKAYLSMVSHFPPLNPAIRDGKPIDTILPYRMNLPLYPAGGDLANVPAPGDTARAADKPVFKTITEVAPTFPGGEEAMFNYLKKNVRYPIEAIVSILEGTVTVNFTINEAGRVIDAVTVGPKLGGHLELEALRLIRSMPKWNPGTNAGKPVPVDCSFPLHFQLLSYKQRKQRERRYPMY